jgi:hypothetical protein
MKHGRDIEDPGRIVIGPDGFAMLALSVSLMLPSLGASLLLAFGHVVWVALRTPCSRPPVRRIVVFGTRLDKVGDRNCHPGRRKCLLGARPKADAGSADLRARRARRPHSDR